MTAPTALTQAFCIALVVGAASDLASRRVPNSVVILAATCGAPLSYIQGGWLHLASGLGAAAIVLAVLTPAWRGRLIGGGDVKLAAASALGIGLQGLPLFVLVSALAGGLIAVVALTTATRESRRAVMAGVILAASRATSNSTSPPSRRTLPYGIAIAVGAIAVVVRTP